MENVHKYTVDLINVIQDFKLGGAHLKKIFWGISCEKSRFYAKIKLFSKF